MKPQSVASCLSKTILLLEKLLHGKHSHRDTKQLETFMTLLREQEATDLESTLLLLPTFTEWIKSAVAEWSSTGATPDTHTVTFALNLASLLSKRDQGFCALNTKGFFVKLVKISKTRSKEAAVKLSYVKLVSTILTHKSGVRMIVASNFWKDVCRFSLSEDCDDVRRASTVLLATLLEKTIGLEEKFCIKVVKRIMTPLMSLENKCLTAEDTTDEVDVGTTIKLICDIMDYFFEGILLEEKDFQVVLLLFENFHLEDTTTMSKFQNCVFDFGKLLFSMQFLDLYVAVSTKTLNVSEIQASVDRIRNNFILSASKGRYPDALDFCNYSQMYWSLVDAKIPQDRATPTRKKSYPIQDQLLGLLLLPNAMLLLNHFFTLDRIRELVREEFRSGFYEKVAAMLSPEVYRANVHWREYILAQSPNLYELSDRIIEQIRESKRYFSRDAAVMTFQSLIYSSKDFIHSVKESRQKRQAVGNDLGYFGKVLEVLRLLIEEFELTWRDSFEIMDVMVVAFDFLSLPRWSTEIVLQALKLINVAVAKYMSPNMALLVDSTEDSIMDLIGPLLYAKVRDEDCAVREAALEVICTMTRMSGDRKSY